MWKKKAPIKTEFTKEDIDHMAERMLQKNLAYNNMMLEQKQKQDAADIKAKEKRNKAANKIIKKAMR